MSVLRFPTLNVTVFPSYPAIVPSAPERRSSKLTLGERVEIAEFQAGLMREQQKCLRKAHATELDDLHGLIRRQQARIEKLDREAQEQDERIATAVVCVSIGNTTKYMTLLQLAEDFEGLYTEDLCTVCLNPECGDQGMCR